MYLNDDIISVLSTLSQHWSTHRPTDTVSPAVAVTGPNNECSAEYVHLANARLVRPLIGQLSYTVKEAIVSALLVRKSTERPIWEHPKN